MILIIGGQGAGKRHYARQLGFTDKDMSPSPGENHPVLLDLHLYLRDWQKQHGRVELSEEQFHTLLGKRIVICNEVGCGIVPMDAADRAWRELVGRVCARLATRAERVVRLCCGIPLCLKGEE